MQNKPVNSRNLFISDLHLHASRPQITRAFFRFMDEQLVAGDTLYILGDFFDAWIGDDDQDVFTLEVINKLHDATSQKNISIFFMHGNRDFLIGNKFSELTGVRLITEPTVIQLCGTSTLLLHGDSLCTDDLPYQQFRLMVRSEEWQSKILAQPIEARRLLAAQLREKSQSMNSLKAEDIMDVNEQAVINALQTASATRLIHGHTHRPARHSLRFDGKIAERIVLGDWHDKAWALIATDSIELRSWPI